MRGGRIGYAIAALAVAVVVGATGCGSNGKGGPNASTGASPGVIRLGALLPMSGDNAPSAASMIPAQNLAVKEANDAGGVLGRRVEVVTADDACDPQTAVNEANKIIQKDITVSVGGYCSSATVPTVKIFHNAGIPMIIPGANSTDLVVPGYDSVFLLAGTTALEAQRMVEWMPTLDTHKVVVVHDGTSFSQTVASATQDAARKPGSGVTVAGELQLSQGAAHYERIAQQIMAAGGDSVFFTGYYAEAGKLIRDLRAAGYPGKILLSDGSVSPALFREVSPAAAEGVYGISLPMAQYEPGLADWSAGYRALAGQDPGPFTMQAYDAVRLALDAIRRAGSLDRAAVRRALAATTPDDIHLLSGSASFKPDGTQKNVRFLLLKAVNGAFIKEAVSDR